MKKEISPRRKRVILLDNIEYSNYNGKPLNLSLMLQHGNIEVKLSNGLKPDASEDDDIKAVILWIPGGGYRGSNEFFQPEVQNSITDFFNKYL